MANPDLGVCGSDIAEEFPQLCMPSLSVPARSRRFTSSSDSVPLYFPYRYVVDAADRDNIPISRNELHDLLSKPSLAGIPLLVLGNKIDKPEALSTQALIDQMYVSSIPFQ